MLIVLHVLLPLVVSDALELLVVVIVATTATILSFIN